MRKLVLLAAAVMGDYCFNDSSSGVNIKVAIDGTNLLFNASSPQGWVGVGVPRTSDGRQMGLGNFYIGDGTTVYQRALAMNVNSKPTQTVNHLLFGMASMMTGQTSISATRPLAPSGGNAIDATKPFYLLWATGNKAGSGFDGINYHGRTRGAFLIDPANHNCGSQTQQGKGKGKAGGVVGKAPVGKAGGKMGKTMVPPPQVVVATRPLATNVPLVTTVPRAGATMEIAMPRGSPLRADTKPEKKEEEKHKEKDKKIKEEKVKVAVTNFVPYPGTNYNVSGMVEMKFEGTGVSMKYQLENADARCVRSTTAANSCGIHIHVGKTCTNNTEIAGHYYNNVSGVDPWTTIIYVANERGAGKAETSVQYGYRFNDTMGRALIIHDQNGTRMACALIPAATEKKKDKSKDDKAKPKDAGTVVNVTNFVPYPGTGSRFNVSGTVVMKFVGVGVSMDYQLARTDVRCWRSNATAPNSCGLHIHVGKTCANNTEIAGHYYDNSTGVDPWLTTVYVSDNRGSAVGATSVTYGYTYDLSRGRAVIVHDQDGARMACSQIP